MKFSLLERFDSAERYPVKVSFHHDPLTRRLGESEHLHDRLHHVLHGVPVVIVEQNLVEGHAHRALIENSTWFRGRKSIVHMIAQWAHLNRHRRRETGSSISS
jgi:hypothetical protein